MLLVLGAVLMLVGRRRTSRRISHLLARTAGRSSTADVAGPWEFQMPTHRALGVGRSWMARVGLVSVLAAALVVGHGAWSFWGSDLATARAQESLEAQLDLPTVAQGRPDEPVTRKRMPKAFRPGAPLWKIRIPKLGVDMVVVEGTGAGQLALGPGHYSGTAYPWDRSGTVGLAGHRTTHLRPFHALDRLVPGDRIELVTKAGTFRYVVSGTRIVEPTDVQVLRRTARPSLVLTTCAPPLSASHRLVVFANRV